MRPPEASGRGSRGLRRGTSRFGGPAGPGVQQASKAKGAGPAGVIRRAWSRAARRSLEKLQEQLAGRERLHDATRAAEQQREQPGGQQLVPTKQWQKKGRGSGHPALPEPAGCPVPTSRLALPVVPGCSAHPLSPESEHWRLLQVLDDLFDDMAEDCGWSASER